MVCGIIRFVLLQDISEYRVLENKILWEENMAIELDKKGCIKWTIGDRVFNLIMILLLGWGDLFGYEPKGGSYEE